MTRPNPFHSGELAVQQRAGASETARRNAGAISTSVLAGARPFLREQSMLLLASRDPDRRLWASAVFGTPGFLHADDGDTLHANLSQASLDPDDPVWANLEREPRVGSLVIDLRTRRRIRINGAAQLVQGRELTIQVEESYPACPKYINRRDLQILAGPAVVAPPTLAAIKDAGTIFVATRSQDGRYDVSHRGGLPGFVKQTGPRTLRWPEFPGNGMFNTLGNLEHDDHAGVIVPDFENGAALQLTGTARAQWDQPDQAGESGGTRLFVEMTFEQWRVQTLPVRSTFIDYSPYNPAPAG